MEADAAEQRAMQANLISNQCQKHRSHSLAHDVEMEKVSEDAMRRVEAARYTTTTCQLSLVVAVRERLSEWARPIELAAASIYRSGASSPQDYYDS